VGERHHRARIYHKPNAKVVSGFVRPLVTRSIQPAVVAAGEVVAAVAAVNAAAIRLKIQPALPMMKR